jgi:hypothetical protein
MSLKRIINTSVSGIDIPETGDYINGSSGFIDVYPQNYDLWAAAIESSSGLVARFTSGQLRVNDGIGNLNTSGGINFLRYPDFADNIRFKAQPLRDNDFTSGTIQEAIEEIDFRRITAEPTGFLNRTSSTISFVNSTRTFTITPIGSYDVYSKGKKYTKTVAESVVITDTEGEWYFYFENNVLTASQTPWSLGTGQIFIANGYWDAVNNLMIIFGEERHGLVMDWQTHNFIHTTIRTQVESNSFLAGNYILTGDGSLATHAQISFTNGFINDEDIRMSVVNAAIPVNPFEQVLSTIAKIPMYYRTGTLSTPLWRKVTSTNFPVYSNSPNSCYYNLLSGSNWTLANATNDYYIATWILATNNISEPIIGIISDNQQSTLIDAMANNVLSQLDTANLPFVKETKFLYRLIFQTSSAYTNTPKAALRNVSSDVTDVIVPASGVTPPFVFSKDGGCTVGTYLRTGSVQTNRTGQIIKGSNYAVEIHVSNQATVASTTRVYFQRRSAVATRADIPNMYVDLPSGQYRAVRSGLQIPIGPDWEICVYNKSGSSLSDPVVIVYFLPAV